MAEREVSGIERLEFFVPTNRVSKSGRKQGMDGLNEIVRQSRANIHVAAKRKRENELHVAGYAVDAMRESGWVADDRLCLVEMFFVEPDDRRDDDNVFAGAKFVLDALCRPRPSGGNIVHANGVGAIVDDDPRHVSLRCARGETDKDNPGVRVRITRMGEKRDGD